MKILETLPVGFWFLDQNDFADRSGNPTYNATLSGTARLGVGLNSFTKYSQNVNSTRTINYTSPVYRNNEKQQSFSLGATFYPISTNAFQVFSRASSNDGLYWNGKSIEFATKYASTGEARCSYTPLVLEKFDVVGVHTESSNSLYVNGSLVAQVDISSEQQKDAYANNSTNFVSASTNGEFLINAVFATPNIVDAERVRDIYDFSNDRHEDEVAAAYDGQTFYLSSDYRFPYINLSLSTDAQWATGQMTNAEIYNNRVNASVSGGTTVESTWEYSVPLANAGSGTFIDTMALDWRGDNVSVQTSYDGGAWTAATKRQKLTNVPGATTMTTQQLQIKVTLAAGQAASYLDFLSVRTFATGSLLQPDTRSVTLNNVVSLDPYQPMRLRDDWGGVVNTSVIFQADPATTPLNPKTVEVWMKRSATVSHNLTNVSNVYVNGLSSSNFNTSTSVGEWALVHFVCTTAQTTLTISGAVQIGSVTFYENSLSATEVSSIYADYTGRNVTPVAASDTVGVTETSALPVTYAHDWSILNS